MTDNKLTILSFCHNLEINGSNNFLLLLLSHLAGQGHKITLASPKPGPLEEDYLALGVDTLVRPIDSENPYSLIDAFGDTDCYDIAIVNTIIRCDGVLISERCGIPGIWVIHETWPLDDIDNMMNNVWKWAWPKKHYIEDAFDVSDNIVYPAQVTRKCYSQNTKGKSVYTIYNGFDMRKVSNTRRTLSREALKRELGYEDDDYVFLQVGSINGRKNQKTSVEAFKKIVDSGVENIKLILLGARAIRGHEIQYITELEQYIESNELSEKVLVLPVTREVDRYYYISDMLLCPSISEVLPYVIIEAMAYGVPSISTNIDGIPEAVVEGETGWLIDNPTVEELCSKMRYVLDNRSEISHVRRACQRLVDKKFSLKENFRNYDALISDVVNNHQSADIEVVK